MTEMIITIGIVLLIIIIIGLIISIFANITIGTPTPVNVLVKPISKAIGQLNIFKKASKKRVEYENEKVKTIKTYELEKELTHEKTKNKSYTQEKEYTKTNDLDKVKDVSNKVKTLKK